MLLPWKAAAMPEIMAGDMQKSKRGVQGGGQTGEQQANSRAAPPEREGVERQKPKRGLTLRLTGGLQRSSELNRRLGDGVKGAVAFECCGVAGDYGWGCGGTQALWHCRAVGRPRSSRPETGQRRRSPREWNSSSQSEA